MALHHDVHDTDSWRPSPSHGCSQRGQQDIASAEILSLPGKPRETAGPADEIWDLGATENLEVLNIDRVSVFRLARFVRGQIGIVLAGKVRPGWLRV